MKKLLLALFGAFCCASLFAAVGSTTPPGWLDDFEASRRRAERENKPILILFTCSDWNSSCIKLYKTVLNTPEFRAFARREFVLCYADMPSRSDFPREQRERNRELRQHFSPSSGSVPQAVIVSPSGVVLGRVFGCPSEPKAYLNQLRGILKAARENPPPKPGAGELPAGWLDNPRAAAVRMRREKKPILLVYTDRGHWAKHSARDPRVSEVIRKKFVPLLVLDSAKLLPREAQQHRKLVEYFNLDQPNAVPIFTTLILPPAIWKDFEAVPNTGRGLSIRRHRRAPKFEALARDPQMYLAELEVALNVLAGKQKYVVPAGWTDDFAAAQERSRKENRPILLYFGASDYSGADIVMRREVLESEEFRSYAEREFVLFYADEPRHVAVPKQVKRQNRALSDRYHVYLPPKIVVVAPDGRCLGFFGGFQPGAVRKLREIMHDRDRIVDSPPTPPGWFDDYDRALREARKRNLPIMLIAVGSDWDDSSRTLAKSVLGNPSFMAAIENEFIPFYADFPLTTRQPERLVVQNRELQKKFRIKPALLLVISPDETVRVKLGYGFGDWRGLLQKVKKHLGGRR